MLKTTIAQLQGQRFALVYRLSHCTYYYVGNRLWNQDKAKALVCLAEFECRHFAELDGVDMRGVTVEDISL